MAESDCLLLLARKLELASSPAGLAATLCYRLLRKRLQKTTYPRNNNASHASVTPDTVSELLTRVTHAEKPWSDFFAQVLSAVMLLVQIKGKVLRPAGSKMLLDPGVDSRSRPWKLAEQFRDIIRCYNFSGSVHLK